MYNYKYIVIYSNEKTKDFGVCGVFNDLKMAEERVLNSNGGNFTKYKIEEVKELSTMAENIYDYINNTESEDYIKLTDEQVDNIVENIIDKVLLDDDIYRAETQTIEYYVNKEIYNIKMRGEF